MISDLWTWTQTSKPVVKSDLTGKCPKCNSDQVLLEFKSKNGVDWLIVTCYICSFEWTVRPADEQKKEAENEQKEK